MERILKKPILQDLTRKIILVSGPRQSGKTTLARSLNDAHDYLNFDLPEHNQAIKTKDWDRNQHIVVFDELHKVKSWKRWLKGIYDTEVRPPHFVVTGSAKIDTYRKVGDSLAGRYFSFRLHPLDLWELSKVNHKISKADALQTLLEVSGYPEPFLEGSRSYYQRWRRTHLDIILRQDLLDEQSVRSIRAIEIMVELLHSRVGSPISHSSLAEDIDFSDKTIKRWLGLLEDSYVLFAVPPFHKNIARSQKKAPKIYLYDYSNIRELGPRFENLVAAALLKQCHYRVDVLGEAWELSYFRTKEKKEIDFLLLKDGTPHIAIEVKWSESSPSKNFLEISKYFPQIKKIQLMGKLAREKTLPDGTEIRRAESWLSTMKW